ncbi:MAG: NACHT domain-containing protein, partial [Desulfobacteraceae bacterium]
MKIVPYWLPWVDAYLEKELGITINRTPDIAGWIFFAAGFFILIFPPVEKQPAWLQNILSCCRYRKHYLKHLFYLHRHIDVKGLTIQNIYTLEVKQVFVELSIAPQSIHKISAAPIPNTAGEIKKDRDSIWKYLSAQPLRSQNFAIIGAPGSGKTTLLKHMTLAFTASKWYQPAPIPKKLPILLLLRNHAATISKDPKATLAQIIKYDNSKEELKTPSGWFEKQLKKGRCLVMLDGLDEVADPQNRQKVANWVEKQMTIHADNRFIITSRPFGYKSNPLNGVTVLEVKPFSSDQIQRFLHNWYLANEIMSTQKDDPGVRTQAKKGAKDLLRRIRNSSTLIDLAVNPLLLTMIATVHRYRSTLPGKRVELYHEVFEVFLGKRREAKDLKDDLTPAQKKSVLQPLANEFMLKQEREFKLEDILPIIEPPLERVMGKLNENATKDFLKLIENNSGLLLERENGIYIFAHLTFQEYLASVHIQEGRLHKELAKKVADGWWHETIRLYC